MIKFKYRFFILFFFTGEKLEVSKVFTEEMGLFLKIMTYCAVQIEVHSFTY